MMENKFYDSKEVHEMNKCDADENEIEFLVSGHVDEDEVSKAIKELEDANCLNSFELSNMDTENIIIANENNVESKADTADLLKSNGQKSKNILIDGETTFQVKQEVENFQEAIAVKQEEPEKRSGCQVVRLRIPEMVSDEEKTSNIDTYMFEELISPPQPVYIPMVQTDQQEGIQMAGAVYQPLLNVEPDVILGNTLKPVILSTPVKQEDQDMSMLDVSGSSTGSSGAEFSSVYSKSPDSDLQSIQKYFTSDNQLVYGFNDTKGEFQLYFPPSDLNEHHNEKERVRRARVTKACAALRKIVPGLSCKTDKASVFEQTARYLKYLRYTYGTQYDQEFRLSYT